MENFSRTDLQQLVHIRDNCCLSLLMPTHRSTAKMEQDQIRFKNLLRQAEKRANQFQAAKGCLGAGLTSAGQLLQDESFWRRTAEGLALFISSERFLHYRLPLSFDELVVLANRFHIKPLLPLFNADVRFYVLAVSQNEIRLFRCSRFNATQIDLPEIPGGMRETLGYDEESGTQLQFHTGTAGSRRQRPAMFHGHAVDSEDRKEEIVQYFRQVDRNVQEIDRKSTRLNSSHRQ